MKPFSLKSKIVLFSSMVFFVLMPLVTSIALHYFQHQFTLSIEGQLFTNVSLLAQSIDQKLASDQKTIHEASRNITDELIHDPSKAETYLNRQYALLSLFDNGLVLFTPEGKIIAETRNKPSRTGFDLSYRPYIQETQHHKIPYISEPFVTTQDHQHPIIVLAAPILDSQGHLKAIFAASIDLLGNNFLREIVTAKVGQTGYFYLFTHDRTMIMHPDPSRIMKQDIPPGANRLLDQAIEGFQGAGETVNSRGLRTMVAFKHLHSVPWILAANFPVAEAYAPVQTAQRTALIIIGVGALVVATLMWLVMRYLIGPLISLTDHIKKIASKQDDSLRVKIPTRDEIGELATSFNFMMAQLDARKKELKQSQELFQTLADWSTDWIFWKSAAGKMLYISPAVTRITGYTPEEIESFGEHFERIVHPDDLELWLKHQEAVGSGNEDLSPLDFRILTRDGQTRWISHFCQPIFDEVGSFLGLRGSNTDITDRKNIEHRLTHLSLHDSLTGLYNRGFFDAEMDRLAGGRRFPISLIVADVDGLKQVNDQLGHVAGDQMIQHAAALLSSVFRSDDVVARIGGDEFAVLIAGADEESAVLAVQRIRLLQAERNLKNDGPKVILSLGVATAVEGDSLERIFRLADERMYKDKKRHKSMTQGEDV